MDHDVHALKETIDRIPYVDGGPTTQVKAPLRVP